MDKPLLTVITPTNGRDCLFLLIESLKKQKLPIKHLILWNNDRDGKFLFPSSENTNKKLSPLSPYSLDIKKDHYASNNIILEGNLTNSSLKGVGLMIADSNFVTFADDNVMWEENHALSMINSIKANNWVYCKRRMWAKLPDESYEYLGVDEFESIGEGAKTEYKTIDNNCIIFRRRIGSSMSVSFREAKENDDRIMYDFLKKYGGEYSESNSETVNVVCEERLIEFFRSNCTI